MKNQLTKLNNSVSAPVVATRDALAERLQSVRETTSLLCNRMMENMGYEQQEQLKDIVEKEVEEEEQQQEEEDIDLTRHEHERALKGAYRNFVMPGLPKTDIDSYFDQTKPYINTLIEKQLKKIGPVKIIMTLWVIWKKLIKLLIKLPEDAKNAQDLDDGAASDIYYGKTEMPLNSVMTVFFDASDINDLIERMFAYIKAQTEWFYTR